MRIELWIPGRPVPQPRYAQGWSKRGKRQAWTPQASGIEGWRKKVGVACCYVHRPGWPLECDVAMGFLFRVGPRPGRRPDLDNLIKGTLDAMVGIVLKDDAQVREYLEPTRIENVTTADLEGVGLVIEYD